MEQQSILETRSNEDNSKDESVQHASDKIETFSRTNQKVLGIDWDENKDILKLGVGEIFKNAEKISPTKRNILKIIASIYDPIGLLQPIVIKLKLLFQEICLLNIAWDDNISPLDKNGI